MKEDGYSFSFMELVPEVSTTIPLTPEGPTIVMLLNINMTCPSLEGRSWSSQQ